MTKQEIVKQIARETGVEAATVLAVVASHINVLQDPRLESL